MIGRILVAAASAVALVCLVAAPADAAPAVSVKPAARGKVPAGIAGLPARGRLVYLLDGRRVRLTRRHAISLSVPRNPATLTACSRSQARRTAPQVIPASTRF